MPFVNLEDIVNAIYEVQSDTQIYYYIPGERLVYVRNGVCNDPEFPSTFDVEDYAGDLIALPDQYERQDYRMMQDFIDEKADDQAADWLTNAIRGKGAFHRFKVTLERFDLLDDWYDYQERRYRELAVSWCEEYGLEYDTSFVIKDEEEDEEIVMPGNKVPAHILVIGRNNVQNLVFMRTAYSEELHRLNPDIPVVDEEDSMDILETYLDDNAQIFAVSDHGLFTGYIVCKEEKENVEILELYVRKEYRRKGLGSMLLKKAEELGTIYPRVFPAHDVMLAFLKANGYTTLRNIELSKPEQPSDKQPAYKIGKQEFTD